MKDDTKAILDDILARWHAWAKGYSAVPMCGADPMFRNARSRGGWDSADDVLDAAINSKIMKAVDFEVGEMKDPHRSAIYMTARNLHTGNSVWNSPRLPTDPMERAGIVVDARVMLIKRLMFCGVM
ncbi:MAG: hypothetical protein JWR74_3200 [Polaromonas sp.]|nr:hypothetical protein [Polaromonas sp.]